MALSRRRLPRALADNRALRSGGDPGRLLAGGLAVDVRGSRALLRSRRIRAWRVRKGRQSAGTEDRRWQPVRSAAPPRVSAASLIRGSSGYPLRSRRAQAGVPPILDAARNPLAAVSGPTGLYLLRLLPGIRLPRRREVVDSGHDAAR